MMHSERLLAMLFVLLFIATPTHAGLAGKALTEAIENAVSAAGKVSGKPMVKAAEKEAAEQAATQLVKRYGDDVLKVVADGGLEVLELAPKYGDDFVRLASSASAPARRALAVNADELLPLARRVGVEALEIEAKVPGQAGRAISIFGDDATIVLANEVKVQDLPRIIKYGEKADSEATRKLLLQAYAKEGASLFERIPPDRILAGGLTAAMIYGTHQVTAPDRAKAQVLRDHPEMVRDLMNQSTLIWALVVFALLAAVIGTLMWRFGLMPWHRKR